MLTFHSLFEKYSRTLQ